jgi:AcrR family transcriptional regulator
MKQAGSSTNNTMEPVGCWRNAMKKQPAVTEQTKQNLMDAFWSFYTRKKIEQITIKAITEKAGYNRGTFYEYFSDVYDVLDQIECGLIPGIDEIPPLQNPASETGMVPLDLFMKLYEKNNRYYAVLLGENGDPAFAGKLKRAVKPMIGAAFFSAESSPIETDYLLEIMLSAMIGILGYWFENGQNLPAERLIALVYDFMSGKMMQSLQPAADR